MARIMILDDNINHLALMSAILAKAGHEIIATQKPKTVVDLILARQPDLLVLDIVMPTMFGGTVYQIIRDKIGPALPIVVCTGTNMQLHAPDDPHLGYVQKPFDNDHFLEAVEFLLNHSAG